jgi:enoyl-CoA hydratase
MRPQVAGGLCLADTRPTRRNPTRKGAAVSYETIRYEPGPVARVVLNRPAQHNALSGLMLRELDDAFRAAVDDPAVRIIVLSGAGASFSAGHELGAPEPLRDGDPRAATDAFGRSELHRDLYLDSHLRWRDLPKPTLAAVHGYCFDGGWMLAAAMDVVFAADDALFMPVYGSYFTASWDLGARKAKEVLYEERILSAAEAEQWGFVNRVYPPGELEPASLRYAGRVAEHSPFTTRTIKFAIHQTLDAMGFSASVRALAPEVHAQSARRPAGELRAAAQPEAASPPAARAPGARPAQRDPRFRSQVGRAMQYLREDGLHPEGEA